jgi:transglutaminase-like putative cysteine protease/tetratricopeptide (TPR) repeat protein
LESGVLRFPYKSDIERFETFEVQVRKPDGRIVATPDSNVQDLPAEVSRQAPTYSSARERQAPVKALGIGDVLEWRVRTIRTKAEIPGQFWFTSNFTKDHVVLEETLRFTLPAGKYVKVSSPSLNPEIREEDGHKTYLWKTSRAEVPKTTGATKPQSLRPLPDVQVTTFKTWEEVGRWYGALEWPKVELTPAIRAKAAELIAGLKTDADKQRAIYQFVTTKFRYISISFGDGRYQPHSAEEVLANQYGDCKDKHTLFAALLRAAGIEAWPALIGAGLSFDPDVPSPAQFDHMITYIPGSAAPVWLDTTPEVAPYGMLQQPLRDRQALVIPENGAPRLMTTAKELPFPADMSLRVESKLAADGSLTGHFDISARGDAEIAFRSMFHATPPAQWSTLAQNLAASMGFGGTVSGLDVDSPTALERPFHYSYDYERKNYPDWENRRLLPPLPPLGLLPFQDREKPSESTFFGAPGKYTHRATVELPAGYSAEVPGETKLQTKFADYSASYSVDKGVLLAERVLVVKISKLAPEQWDEFRTLAKAVAADATQFIPLVRADAASETHVVRDVPEAAALVRKAAQAIQTRDLSAARDALASAERLNAGQIHLGSIQALLYELQNQNEKAIEALKKEILYHPGNEASYRLLAEVQGRSGRPDDAIDTLRRLVKIAPQNTDGVLQLVSALFQRKKYGEAVEPLQVALKGNPNHTRLETALLEALLRGGQKTEALVVLAEMRKRTLDAGALNSAAYSLADTEADSALAKELSERAVSELESQLRQVTLPALTSDDLRVVRLLGATWDTLGWAAFRLGDLGTSEKYVRAAWVLTQRPTLADHLGQIYERQGKKAEAIHAYELALVVKNDSPEIRQRLEKLGGGANDRPAPGRGAPASPPRISPEEELSQLRTAPIPELAYQKGSAEFFLLLSVTGVEDVQFIRGDEGLKGAASALRKGRYNMPFPDQGPEKILRRGILSCSQYTKPNCNLVFLLPANTTK